MTLGMELAFCQTLVPEDSFFLQENRFFFKFQTFNILLLYNNTTGNSRLNCLSDACCTCSLRSSLSDDVPCYSAQSLVSFVPWIPSVLSSVTVKPAEYKAKMTTQIIIVMKKKKLSFYYIICHISKENLQKLSFVSKVVVCVTFVVVVVTSFLVHELLLRQMCCFFTTRMSLAKSGKERQNNKISKKWN